jgi:hypothetical protein
MWIIRLVLYGLAIGWGLTLVNIVLQEVVGLSEAHSMGLIVGTTLTWATWEWYPIRR